MRYFKERKVTDSETGEEITVFTGVLYARMIIPKGRSVRPQDVVDFAVHATTVVHKCLRGLRVHNLTPAQAEINEVREGTDFFVTFYVDLLDKLPS